MKRNMRVLVILLVVAYPVFAWGNDFRLVPSLSVKEEYNSNILFSTDDLKRDFVTTVSPGLEMMNRTERLDSGVLLKINRFDYAGHSEFSATDKECSGRLKYFVTPLASISAEAAYVKDSRPDRDIGTTGIVLTTVPRHNVTSSLSTVYQLSEKTTAGVSYNYGRSHFEGRGYLDDTSHNVGAGLNYDLGAYVPTLKGRINAGYGLHHAPYSRVENVTGTVGFSRDIDETWTVLVDGGIRRTQAGVTVTRWAPVVDFIFGFPVLVGYEPVKEHVKNKGWGWVGTVSLDYHGERGSGSVSYGRDVLPASGLEGAAERNSLAFSARYRLTYEWSLMFSSDYFTNKSAPSKFSVQAIDQQTFRINPGLRYEFSKDSGAETAYEYVKVDDQAAHAKADRHLFTVRLYMQHSFFE